MHGHARITFVLSLFIYLKSKILNAFWYSFLCLIPKLRNEFLHANDTEKSSRDRALLDKLETIASKLTTMKDVNSGVVIDL